MTDGSTLEASWAAIISLAEAAAGGKGNCVNHRLIRHFRGPRVCSAALGDVVFNLYLGTPTCHDLDMLFAAQREQHAERGRRLGVLSVSEPGITLPPGEVRRHAAELNADVESIVAVSATVVAGGGFWLSAALSMVNTVLLIGATKRPNRIYRELDQGVDWIVGHLDNLDSTAVSTEFATWRQDQLAQPATAAVA